MQIKNYLRCGLKIFLLSILVTNTTWANLLIAPTRVVFDERARSSAVNLVNTSNKTTTYRLGWIEKRQLSNGKYAPISKSNSSFPLASSMLRFSPRQFTLAPGQRQTVRIALRRKKDMKNGDYHSHLLFQALPDSSISEPAKGGASFDIKVNLGFSIPVIVRQGKYNTKITISEAKMIYTKTKNKTEYGSLVLLSKKGDNSIYGGISIFWKKKINDRYKKIGQLNNVAMYQEINKLHIPIGFTNFQLNSGFIKIKYEGVKDLKDKITDIFERKVLESEFEFIVSDR